MSANNTKSPSRLSPLAPPFNLKSSFLLDNHNFQQVSNDRYYLNSPYDHLQSLHAHSTATQPHATHKASSIAISASMSYNTFLKQDECILSYTSDCNSSPARVTRLSGANKTLSLLKPGLSEDIDSRSDDAVINNEDYAGRLSGTFDSCGQVTIMTEPCVLLNSKRKVVCYEKAGMVKGKEEKNGQYVLNEARDPLVIEKRELPITSDIPDLESRGTESGVPLHNSPKSLDQNESGVDSPCWKGTGTNRSIFGVTRPVGSQFPKLETEARKSLNPLAPHFFPGSAIPLVEYHENECLGNDSLSTLDTPSSVVALSSKEHCLTFSLKAGSCPMEVSNLIETQTSKSIHGGGKEYALPNKANGSSVINSSIGDQLYIMEDHLTSNRQSVMVPIVAGSAKGSADNIHNGSSSLTFGVTGNFMTSSCVRDSVSSSADETLRVASKPPKLDVQLVINTMHGLSELLKWSYSNVLDSVSEHEHHMIQHIINNLYVCLTNGVGQVPESGHPCTSYSPRKLSDRLKEFQVTTMKAMTVPRDWEMQKSWSTSPVNNEGINKVDGYPEIFVKALKENPKNKEEMCTQSLLYGNSMPEAEAALEL